MAPSDPPSTGVGASSSAHSRPSPDKLAALAMLPRELSAISEEQLFRTAAHKLAEMCSALRYIRITLVSETMQPEDVWEVSHEEAVPAALQQLEADVDGAHLSQGAALQQRCILTTAHHSMDAYQDWSLLGSAHGMTAAAAVPLCVGDQAYGVLLLAWAQIPCMTSEALSVLESVGSMLAPYAAMQRHHRKLRDTRRVLELLLPPRVVASISERVGWGNNPLELQH